MDSLLTVLLSNAVAAVVLALVALIAGRVLRRPALTHGLWLLVLLKLLTPPLVRIPVSWPSSEAIPVVEQPALEPFTDIVVRVDLAEEPDPDEATPLPSPEPVTEPREKPTAFVASNETSKSLVEWTTVFAVIWASGSVIWLTVALRRIRELRRLLRFAEAPPSWLSKEIAELATRLGLKQTPDVLLMPGKVSPMVWSLFGSPRLLLPVELLSALSAEQRSTLLLHELAHLHRRDHWVRRLELIAAALYWWHPVVWLARRELREAEEQCCDAWVVWALPGAGRVYADALVSCVDFLSDAPAPLPVGASGLGHIVDLKRRLLMILKGTTPRRLTWSGAVFLLGLGLLLLPLLPSWAQDRREPRPQDRKEPTAQDRKPDPKEIEKAREDIEKLKQELMEQMKKVKVAEDRLCEAAERLGKMEGKGGGEGIRVIIIKEGEKRDFVVPRFEFEKRIELEHAVPGGRIERFQPERPQDARIIVRPFTPGVPAQPATPRADGGDRRIQELERKLDAILREMEEMRRGMRGGRPEERGPGNPRLPQDRPGENVRPREGDRPGPGGRPPEERRPAPRDEEQEPRE